MNHSPSVSEQKAVSAVPRPIWVGLALLLVLSCVGRIPGLNYGFPEIVLRDEATYAGAALKMLQQGTLDPGEYRYGNLLHYLYYLTFAPLYFASQAIGEHASGTPLPQWPFYHVARSLSLISSLGCLVLLFELGRRLFSARVGLLAAALLALQPLFFRYGRLAKPDIFVLLFSLMAALVFLDLYQKGGRRRFWLAGVTMALGFSVKYSMIALCPCVIAVFGLMRKRVADGKMPPEAASWRGLIEAFGVALILVVVLNLSALLNFKQALLQFQRQYHTTVQGRHIIAATLPSLGPWAVLTQHLPGALGWPLGIAAVAGWIGWGFKDGARWLIVALYPVVHYVLVCRWGFAFPRELIPIYPPLYLGAAWALDRAGQFSGKIRGVKAALGWLLLLGLLGFSLAGPIQKIWDKERRIVGGNTKVLAKQWVQHNVPPSARIAREMFVLPMSETHPDEVFARVLGDHSYQYYIDQKVQYLIKSRLPQAALEANPDVARNDREIEARAERLAQWNGRELGIEGPNLAVFRVRENTGQSPQPE